MRKAVFPGSFDPFTNGHFDIVSRALPLFDEIVVAIGHNSKKNYLFDLESRIALLNSDVNGEIIMDDDPVSFIDGRTI